MLVPSKSPLIDWFINPPTAVSTEYQDTSPQSEGHYNDQEVHSRIIGLHPMADWHGKQKLQCLASGGTDSGTVSIPKLLVGAG